MAENRKQYLSDVPTIRAEKARPLAKNDRVSLQDTRGSSSPDE